MLTLMDTSDLNSFISARSAWLDTALGKHLYELECQLSSQALSQVFGWQLLQIGAWGSDTQLIAGARTQRKALVVPETAGRGVAEMTIRSRLDSLGIATHSIDAVLLPHTLEQVSYPHELLREVERILLGDGQLVLFGFRPLSAWGLRNFLRANGLPPGTQQYFSEHRIRDWLRLLGFEVIESRRYLFNLPVGSPSPRTRRLLESLGNRFWPLLAGAYMLRARKRLYTVTPIRTPVWAPSQPVGGLLESGTRMQLTDKPSNSSLPE